jgi:hypothetical protein
MTIAADIFTYGPPIDLATSCLVYYRDSFVYTTDPNSLIWQNVYNPPENSTQLWNLPSEISPGYSYPVRNQTEYCWQFNASSKTVFWSDRYISGPSKPLGAFTMAISYNITNSATYGNKIVGFQNTLPDATSSIFDKQFWINEDTSRISFGVFNVSNSTRVVVVGQPTVLNKWHIATVTYSPATQKLIMYSDLAQTDFKITGGIDNRVDSYLVAGGGTMNSTWSGANNGINFITGKIGAYGIWNKTFSEREVFLLQAYMKLN